MINRTEERRLSVRAVRGATTTHMNSSLDIRLAAKELLEDMVAKNRIPIEDIISVIFSVTPDLNAAFPASAARELGWTMVPLFGTLEADVPGAPEKCIRVLITFNTDMTQEQVKHSYLRGAECLRPDLVIKEVM